MPDSTFTATPSLGAQSAPSPAKAGPVIEFKPPPALNLKPPKPAAPAPAPAPAAEKAAPPPPKAEEAPAPPAEPPKEAKPEPPKSEEPPPRKHKLKVDGEELELEEAEVLRRAQKTSAADRRFEEAARLKREAAQETQRARELFAAAKDPKKLKQVLSDPRVGADVKLIAKEWLAEALREQIAAQEYGPLSPEEEAKLTPEQRELRQLKREAKERERKAQEDAAAAEKAKADEAEKAEQERVAKHRDELGNQILAVMKEAKHLPQDAVTARRVSAELRRNIEEGRPFDVKDVVERLDLAEGKDLARRLRAMGVAKVRAHLPPEFLSEFRDADVADYKARGGKPLAEEPKPAVAPALQQPEKKGYSEAELRSQLQGKRWTDFAPAPGQPRHADGRFK